MASVGAGATGGAITPATSEGIVVSDVNDRDRVLLGHLGGGDYGLKVVGADGSTVIIDGTSNIFKIVATGTMDWPSVAANNVATATVTLSTGLTYDPASAHFSLGGTAAIPCPQVGVNAATGAITTLEQGYAELTGTDQTLVTFSRVNATGSALGTKAGRYYVFQEAAL